MKWLALEPTAENFFFVRKDFSGDKQYREGWSIGDIFVVWQNGLKTDRDELFFDFKREILEQRMRLFYEPKLDAEFRARYNIAASSSYDIEARRRATRFMASNLRLCLYRPMDLRWLYYDPNLTSRPAEKVMKHMLEGPTLGLITTRQTQDKWDLLVTTHLCGHKSCAAYDINSLFPLYLYEETLDLGRPSGHKAARRPNFAGAFLADLGRRLKLSQAGGNFLPGDLVPEEIF
jgi:predicted helicase